MTKDYELIIGDVIKGEYFLDEKGGVLIETSLALDTFYSQFEIAGTRITSLERLKGDTMTTELIVFKTAPRAGTAPELATFPFSLNQRCELTRQ